jgi:hypothetical protein
LREEFTDEIPSTREREGKEMREEERGKGGRRRGGKWEEGRGTEGKEMREERRREKKKYSYYFAVILRKPFRREIPSTERREGNVRREEGREGEGDAGSRRREEEGKGKEIREAGRGKKKAHVLFGGHS